MGALNVLVGGALGVGIAVFSNGLRRLRFSRGKKEGQKMCSDLSMVAVLFLDLMGNSVDMGSLTLSLSLFRCVCVVCVCSSCVEVRFFFFIFSPFKDPWQHLLFGAIGVYVGYEFAQDKRLLIPCLLRFSLEKKKPDKIVCRFKLTDWEESEDKRYEDLMNRFQERKRIVAAQEQALVQSRQ